MQVVVFGVCGVATNKTMDEKMKLSFVVPIYNVEPYLRRCVDSLLTQDLPKEEYEIILVDDGSPDNCPAICDEYANAYENIQVIHRPNGGLSAARNSGIAIAKGEYVCFVDSDDYWEENVLGGLMEQVEREELDVLRFDYRNVRIRNNAYEEFEPNKQPHQVDRRIDVVDGITYLNERMGYACYAVMYIVRRELLTENEIFFTEGIHFEDTDWTPRMLLVAQWVNSTPMVVYNYLVREGSITQTGQDVAKKRKNVEDIMGIINKMRELYKQTPQCVWLKQMQSSMVAGVLTSVACDFYKERKVYINRLKEMHVFPLVIANHGSTYRRRAALINIHPRIYIAIYHFVRSVR